MLKKEMDIIAEYLRTRNTIVPLRDIITATEGVVQWLSNPSEQMNAAIKKSKRISRPKRGFYEYVGPKKSEPNIVVNTPKKEEPIKAAPKTDPVSEAVAKATQPPKVKADIEKPSAVVQNPPQQMIQPKAAQLRVGDEITCMITGIEDYGVFAECPEYGVTGLIHKSKIKFGKLFFNRADLERHFRYGDWIRAKVDSFRNNGRLSLTTVGYELPDYSNSTTIAEQLKQLTISAEPVRSINSSKPTPQPSRSVSVPAPIAPPQPVKKETASAVSVPTRDELDDLYEMVKKKVGVMSMSGKDALKDVVRRYGLVKVTMAMMSSNDFEADVSLAYVRYVESKVNGGL